MSDPASELIERMERETGQRVDDNGFDNMAIVGLFGALARGLGQSHHQPRDDVAAGVLARYRTTEAYRREQEGKRALVSLLVAGVSPDDCKDLLG